MNAAPIVLLNGQNGAQLLEYNFYQHKDLIDAIVSQSEPEFEIEPAITVFGKQCRQPRDVQFCSDESKGYFYSNQVMTSKPLTDEMKTLLDIVNQNFKANFNGILINRYVDGTKSVGAHADDESGLNEVAGVVAISHGVTRNFRIRDIKSKAIVGNYDAKAYMALQMAGPFQQQFTHEIPMQKTIKSQRISLTFRQHDAIKEAALFAKMQSRKRARGE